MQTALPPRTASPSWPSEAPAGERFLEPARGGPAARFAALLGRRRHPALVFLAAMLAGLIVVSALSIGAGFLITRVLVHIGAVGSANRHVDAWLAAHRSGDRTEASLVGSIAAGWIVLPILVALIGAALALARKWRLAAYAIAAPVVEVVGYRATTLVVHEHRPEVVRLEKLPLEASYPSGHTAAAVAVYSGLLLLLATRTRNRGLRALLLVAAVAIPVFVAFSRMYRGMHYPLDAAGGALLGIAALAAVVFCCRAAAAAAASRAQTHDTPAT